MARKRKGISGMSFSWKRATGLSAAKGKLSRQIGIPLTKSGRQRKMGRAMGCCVPAAFILLGVGAATYGTFKLIGAFLV